MNTLRLIRGQDRNTQQVTGPCLKSLRKQSKIDSADGTRGRLECVLPSTTPGAEQFLSPHEREWVQTDATLEFVRYNIIILRSPKAI